MSVWKVSVANSCTETGTECLGERFPVALGLIYSNKTCDATSLGELSRDSQNNNFLPISALLTVLEITASVREENNQTGPLIPRCFAQPRVLLETWIPV